jgi:hypothetical protein
MTLAPLQVREAYEDADFELDLTDTACQLASTKIVLPRSLATLEPCLR